MIKKTKFWFVLLTMLPLLGSMVTAQAAPYTSEVISLDEAASVSDSYTMEDFERVPKIDVHTHIHTNAEGFISLLKKDNFSVLTINVDYDDFPPLPQQQLVAIEAHQQFPQRMAFVGTFPVDNFSHSNWIEQTLWRIDEIIDEGAVGIKVWKNIGMELKDETGKMVMLDDRRLAPVFQHLEQQQIVLLNHIGEPKNCWLPVEKMTVLNDREYFQNHPQYHMYQHPELPSYEQQIASRDAMLERYPNLPFVGVHMASLEWSVDELGRFLDRFPTAMIDLAARMGQVQYQSNRDREKVRRFFIEYQDRLIYGSDVSQSAEQSVEEFNTGVHALWLRDWRYLNTSQVFKVPELNESVKGLALPKAVVDKIYWQNARTRFPDAWAD